MAYHRQFLYPVLVLFVLLGGIPRPAVGDDSKAAMARLMKHMDFGEMLGRMSDSASGQLIVYAQKKSPGLPAAAYTALDKEIRTTFRKAAGQLKDATIAIYAKFFSLAEINAIGTFYATPTGRKMAQILPFLVQENVKAGQSWGQKYGQIAFDRWMARMRREGHIR